MPDAKPSNLSVSMVQSTVFEGLFRRALKPTPALVEELRRIGYDPERPKTEYPMPVWSDCLEAARRHVYPTLSRAEGMEALGRDFANGYLETIVGKVIGAALPLLGPARALRRLPNYFTTARTDVTLTVDMEGDRRARVRVADPYPMPEMLVGIIIAGLRKTGVEASVSIERQVGYNYDLLVSW